MIGFILIIDNLNIYHLNKYFLLNFVIEDHLKIFNE